MNIYRQKILNSIFIQITLVILVLFNLACDKAVSVPPPDSPPPNGFIFIDSYPEGKQIFIDQKDRRRITPDSITWLETNDYLITLKHPYYRDTSITIQAKEGVKESLYVDYSKNLSMLGSILCSSYPSNAEIRINDSLLQDKTPYKIENLLPGNYKLSYTLANHKGIEANILVTSNNVSENFYALVDTTKWKDFNSDNSTLSSDNLTCIVDDGSGILWIGSNEKGAFRYDGNNFENFYTLNSGLFGDSIRGIVVREPNEVWFAAEKGVSIYNNGGWLNFIKDYGAPMPSKNATAITKRLDNQIWIGTDNGLLATVFQENAIQYSLYFNTDIPATIPGNKITCISSLNNDLVVGTKRSGAVIFSNYIWATFNTSNSLIRSNSIYCAASLGNGDGYVGYHTNSDFKPGLAYLYGGTVFADYYDTPDNNVYSIYLDSSGRIWLGTELSIINFTDWSTKEILTYENTGLPIKKITGITEDVNGDYWFTSLGSGLFQLKRN